MADIAKGLSDLGLMSDTQSSAVQNGPTLDDLLFNSDSIVENTKKIQDIESKQAAGPQTGFLDKLKDPHTLIPLLLSLGAGIATKNPALAAGGATGSLMGADQAAQQENKQYAATLEKQKKDAKDELDKSRQLLNNLFNTNPEALVSSDGTPMTPKMLGWYLTGTPIGVDGSARRNAEMRGTRWQKKLDVLVDGVKKASSLEDAKSLTNQVLTHLSENNTPPDPELVDQLARSAFEDPSKFDATFAARLLELGPNVGAITYASENGLPLSNPDVLRMVKLYPKDSGNSKESVPDRNLKLMDEVTRWTLDPANAKIVAEIRSKTTTTKDAAIALTNAALATRPNEATLQTNFLKSNDYVAELMQSFMQQVSGEKNINDLKTYGNFDKLMNETPEQAQRRRMDNATRDVTETKKAANKAIINQVVQTRDAGAQKLANETGLGQEAVYSIIDQVYRRAVDATPIKKDGTRDMAAFQKNFQTELKKEIEANK